MSRVLVIPSLLLFLLAAVSYFLSATSPANGPKTTQKPIVFCNGDEIGTLDVGKMSWAADIRAAMGLWEGLATYDPKDLSVIPGSAERWTVSEDGKTYTFYIRPSAKWSNGAQVASQDFTFAWKRVLTPSTGSDYIGLLQNLVVGAQEFTDAVEAYGQAKAKKQALPPLPEKIAGVETPDARTLVVRLKAPCSYFLDLCAFPTFYPLYAPAMEPFLDKEDPTRGYEGPWTHPPRLVTNGPYQLTEWVFKKHLLYTPNPHYWDRQNVKCEALYIKAIPGDDRAALLALQTGMVDALSFVPKSFGEELLIQQKAGVRKDVHHRATFGSYYYLFNCQIAPFDDKRVRKALAISLDREAIVTKITRMGQKPIGLFVPPDSIPGNPTYISPPELPRDVELAKRLLAEAGFPGGKGLRTLEILVNSDDAMHKSIAESMGQMWEQNLGVKVSIRALERSGFMSARSERKDGKPTFDIARGGWNGDYMDPTTWLDLLRSADNNNDGRFMHGPYDDLMNKAGAETDAAKRFALLRDAEAMALHDQAAIIPLYQYTDGYMFDGDKIKGLDVNVRLLTQLKWIRRAE